MLSIGKLSAGRENYYTAQLPGGADEYYTRPATQTEAVWLGSARDRLGLSGPVDPDDFRALLAANDPRTGDPLGIPATTARRLPAYDLCFSAPKSVSTLWALAPPEIAAQVAAAHDRAVAHAVAALETEVVRARRGGHHNTTLVPTEGVAAAAFGHRTSRAGDPQMHTHVVVPNLTVTDDGRWSAISGDRIYGWAKTIGYLYQAALRAELTESLGIGWGPVHKGAAEVSGVPAVLVERFSTRRHQITAAVEAAGAASRQAHEIAAVSTRAAKDHDIELDSLRRRWAATAVELGAGIDIGQVAPVPRRLPPDRTTDLSDELAAPSGLTANATSFDRRDVLQAIAAGHPEGLHPDVATRGADRFFDRQDVVALAAATRLGGPRYSTVELLAVEADLVERGARRRDGHAGQVPADIVEATLAARPSLTDEQKAMVRSLTTTGAGVELIVGRAGSGKTFALDAARQAWTAAGYHVVGAALAARAAAELQDGSGIAATTVDRLLADLDRPGPFSPLGRHAVLVIDEAAMVGTRKLARLAEHAERAGAKLVLVGDHRQVPEIEAGGAFAALARHVPVSELARNRRQAELWERDALAELRSGSVSDAVTAYRDAGRIHLAPSADDARRRLVDDWWAARGEGQVAMYALRRADVDDLNHRARAHLQAAGQLGEDRIVAAGRELAVGEEIICLRNDRALGVRNGTRGVIAGIDHGHGSVTLADGTVLPSRYLHDGHVGYSYATTVHKGQGATVDRAFLLGSDTLYREAGYVGLSRARESTQLYVVGDSRGVEGDPLAETIRHLGSSRAQTFASEQLPERPRMTGGQALAADPPEWLRDALGAPPVTAEERNLWRQRAERLAAYRDIYAVTDTKDALGPQPRDPEQQRAWRLAQLAIDDHQRSIEREQGLTR